MKQQKVEIFCLRPFISATLVCQLSLIKSLIKHDNQAGAIVFTAFYPFLRAAKWHHYLDHTNFNLSLLIITQRLNYSFKNSKKILTLVSSIIAIFVIYQSNHENFGGDKRKLLPAITFIFKMFDVQSSLLA